MNFPDTSKINNGDYIDIKLGAPTDNGKYVNYTDSIVGNTPININDDNDQPLNIGNITAIDSDTESPYYRLTFNSNIQKVINPTINLSLVWLSKQQQAITLVGYTKEQGKNDTIAPTNDFVIGDHTYTSGLSIPVIYLSPDTGHSVQSNTIAMATDVSVQHMWVVNSDGTETLQPNGIATHIDIRLADKLSNHFTVTVQVPDPATNDFFAPQFASDDAIAQSIKNAIMRQQSTLHVHDQLADDNSIGIGATLDSTGATVPNVTVTSTNAADDDGYLVKKYKIDIDASQDVKLGNYPITFAIVYTRPGVDISPASGINTYVKDKASYDQREQENAAIMNAADNDNFDWNKAIADGQAVAHDGWYFVATYNGPELANTALQKYMTSHEAGYASIHDDGDNSNNTGYDHNVPFGSEDKDVTNINFLVNIATEPATINNTDSHKNIITVNGKVATQSSFQINYVDQDDNNKILHTDNQSGNAGSDSHYTTKGEIDILKAQGYVLVSDDTNGQSVQFPSQNSSHVYTVKLKHGTQKTSQTKDIKEIIHYQYGNGKQALPDHTETATLVQQGTKDLVTGKTKWQDWSQGSWKAVQSPNIQNYTPTPANIPGQTVTNTTNNVEKTVVYIQNAAQQAQLTINYLDTNDNDRILVSKQFNGNVGNAVGYNTQNDLAAFKKQHYLLVTDPTLGADLTIGQVPQTINVLLKHDHSTKTDHPKQVT